MPRKTGFFAELDRKVRAEKEAQKRLRNAAQELADALDKAAGIVCSSSCNSTEGKHSDECRGIDAALRKAGRRCAWAQWRSPDAPSTRVP